MKFKSFSCVLLFVGLAGCATNQTKASLQDQLDAQGRLIQKQARVIQDLSDENLILRELVGPSQPVPLIGHKSRPKNQNAKTESFLYAQVVKGFNENRTELLQHAQNLMLKMYPESVFADNAIYLVGKHYYGRGDYAKALKSFDQLLTTYPRGDLRAAATLGKGLAYKMLNLTKQTKTLLGQVIDDYPGSPEASQAKFELKAIALQ